MSSEQSSASADAARTQGALASQAYGLALPNLKAQYGLLNQSLNEGGEPGYLRDAFDSQRTGITEGLARQSLQQERQGLFAGKGAVAGGNANGALTPQNLGAQIAEQMYSSRLNEGLGRVEQMNKLISMGLGQSAQVGNAGIGAGQAQLQGIAGLPAYNSTYATIAGLGALGAAGYGGYQQYAAAHPSGPAGFNGVNYSAQMPGMAASQWGLGASPAAGNAFGAGVTW